MLTALFYCVYLLGLLGSVFSTEDVLILGCYVSDKCCRKIVRERLLLRGFPIAGMDALLEAWDSSATKRDKDWPNEMTFECKQITVPGVVAADLELHRYRMTCPIGTRTFVVKGASRFTATPWRPLEDEVIATVREKGVCRLMSFRDEFLMLSETATPITNFFSQAKVDHFEMNLYDALLTAWIKERSLDQRVEARKRKLPPLHQGRSTEETIEAWLDLDGK
ncbi:hypothetical protein MRB53_040904 [Persea americana]|nr:hypothetical protein MRB53_040904 [Persea americana]